MPYRPIDVDLNKHTIMGVDFDTIDNFESTANALGTAMFEGFNPTPKGIEIIRDYLSNKITIAQLAQLTKERAYA